MKTETLDKRIQIIDTALSLFTNQGLQQTSMAQLSKESGVAVGTMYLNFKSKDDLIEGIFLYIQESYGNYIELDDAELQLPFKEQFKLVSMKTYNYYLNNPSHFYFIDTHNYSPLISKNVREQGRRYYQQGVDIIIKGVEENIFKDIHPIVVIRLVYNCIVALVQIRLNDEVEVTDSVLEDTLERIWKLLT